MNSNKKDKKSLLKRITSFLVVLCMMCGFIVPLSSVTAYAAAPESYTTIMTDSTEAVSITSSGSAKYFKFVPTQSGTYEFYSTNYTADPKASLLDASGNTLVTDDDSGSDNNFSFTYACTAGTTYYVKAYMWSSSSTGSYTLNVRTVSVVTPTPTPTPAGSVVEINAAGGTNYPLFNSGATGDKCKYGSTSNYDDASFTNGGYDLYAEDGTSVDTIQLGLSFKILTSSFENVNLNIYSYDVDESGSGCEERDYIYLVDETTGAAPLKLSGYLSGQNDTWNNSNFTIPADYFEVGHTYHFLLEVTCTNGCTHFWVYTRTVAIVVNGASEPPVNPTTGIENADLSASISSSGLVSVDLTANAYAAENYTLEYKAVCSADSAQYGGKEYSVTIPTTSAGFVTTFQLESGAPRGTYEITVFIKDSAGTVIATRTATASYGYSAVSYNANGGSQNLPTDGTTYSSGDTVTVKFDYVPSMYGCTFLGWSTDRNATEPMYTENGTKTFTIGASDVTLYAVWGLDVCEHEWSETTHTDATCTTDGLIVNTCSLCGDTQESEIPAIGHNYVSGVCTRCGAEAPAADVWDGTVDTSWYNSTDTEFIIYTAEQLAGLAQLVNNGNTFSEKTIYLGNNIDLANREWTPIGNETHGFSGTFNGNKNIIYNMTITGRYRSAGLFGYTLRANISNIGLENVSIDVNYSGNNTQVGALIGGQKNGTVSNCYMKGSVACSNNDQIPTGGLIGIHYSGTVRNCYAISNVTVTSSSYDVLQAGGLIGATGWHHNETAMIENCFAVSVVTGTTTSNLSLRGGIGGLVGDNYATTCTVSNCFVLNCNITSRGDRGAIYGSRDESALSLIRCYYANTSVPDSFGGTSTNASNFQSQSWIESTLGWDFDTVWEFRAGSDYPVLQGFDAPTPPTPHIHDFEETSRTEPTCTVDGRINYACSCGETKVGVIPAIGHNIETTIETEVTCTTDGLIVDRCVNDGCDYEKRTVIHGEHNYSVTDRQDAACETPGYVEYTCSNCGDKKYEYFDGAHNYVESARVEPQIEVEGSITYTCTLCGDSYDIILPALTPVLKNSSVLLIQDSLPWAENVNRSLLETLKGRGVVSSYNIINTSALASFDLTQYGVVFIANDQTTAMYERLAANAEKLEAYVRAGGNLIYGACDEGWGGCGSLTHTLPGGVTTSNYYSVHNYIVNELHPVVTGVNTDNRSLRDELLKGNYCSHTYFNKATLPAGTDIILRDANGNPTLIEYNLGDGTVIASGLTWEYFYVRDHYNMVTNYSKYAYDDLLTYMVYMSNTCEHNYELVETVAPTCEENGYTKYVCTLCSHEYMGDIVLPNDHTPGEWIVDIPASCVPGSQHKECTVCEVILETGAIAPTSDHTSSDWIIDVVPTATQTGRRHKECTICQTVLETEVMPILAKLVIDTVEAEAGHTVRVSIDVQNNPGIIGALLTLNYDPALTLVNVEAGNAWSTLNFTSPAVFSNPCNFVWDGVNNADFNDGTIIILTFEVPTGVDVGTVYNIGASYTYGNMINADLEAVEMEIENGSITVINTIGDVNDDGVVDVADVIVLRRYLAAGYEVTIDEFAADMNGDGYITVTDVVLLRRFLVN